MLGMFALGLSRYFAFYVLVFNSERMKLLNKNVLKYYTRAVFFMIIQWHAPDG